jgi:hypothetical protein
VSASSPLIDAFDRIYVINLADRTDRRTEALRELTRLGVSEAVGSTLFLDACRPTDPGEFPSIGVKGCFLSHLAALRDATERGHRRILVFEDDIEFESRLLRCQSEVARRLDDESWSLAYLGHGIDFPIPARPDEFRFEAYEGPFKLAHAVAFQGDAIPALVGFLETVASRSFGDPRGGPMHVDGAYNTFREQNSDRRTVVAVPSLVGQRASRSDISPKHWFDRLSATRAFADRARLLKLRIARTLQRR